MLFYYGEDSPQLLTFQLLKKINLSCFNIISLLQLEALVIFQRFVNF